MRNEEEVLSLILNVAENDERIRAALLTGLRANPNVEKDSLQDFDIIYIVTALEVAQKLNFYYNQEEANKVRRYL